MASRGSAQSPTGDSDQEKEAEEEVEEDGGEEAGESAWVQVQSKNYRVGDLYWYSPLRPRTGIPRQCAKRGGSFWQRLYWRT